MYALTKTKKYSRPRAVAIFEQGVKPTKEIKKQRHEEMLLTAKNIDPEDQERYRHKVEMMARNVLVGVS